MKNQQDIEGLELFCTNHHVYSDKRPVPDFCGELKPYIMAIAFFHKNISGSDIRTLRLTSSIGKEVEKIKWDSKVVRRFINDTINSKEEGPLKDFFKEFGNIYSDETLKIVETFNDSRYLDIIRRSMYREEVCLIDTTYMNIFPLTKLSDENKNVYVNYIDKCCYNLAEIDYGNFLINVMEKNNDLNFNINEILDYIINLENLEDYSKDFMLNYINYPNKFTKYILRYMEDKRQWSQEELVAKLMKIIKKNKLFFKEVEAVG